MHRKNSRIKYLIKVFFRCLLACIVVFVCLPCFMTTSKADYVTDNIGVYVGYPGMELEDYVLVGDYHISEIEANLPIYEEAYSFFKADDIFPEKYNYIVDSARGILISDLLNYAHIYYGDVYNLQFWVQDHNGMWCAFDRDDLFAGNRYYFNDLPGHRKIIYATYPKILGDQENEEGEGALENEDGEGSAEEDETYTDYTVILGYDFDKCWDDCVAVPPMLAIEDNWVSFNEEFESAGPDFTYLNTGSRFRLLYGQYSPTESDSRDSAKWVRYVYVTLNGRPKFGEMPPLEGEYGSHTIETKLSVHDDLVEEISDLINFYSTNEDVLQITNVTIVPDETYADMVKIVIDYDIVGDGEAAIGGNFGSTGAFDMPITQVVNTEEYKEEQDPETKDTEEDNPEKIENPTGNGDGDDPTGDGDGDDPTDGGGGGEDPFDDDGEEQIGEGEKKPTGKPEEKSDPENEENIPEQPETDRQGPEDPDADPEKETVNKDGSVPVSPDNPTGGDGPADPGQQARTEEGSVHLPKQETVTQEDDMSADAKIEAADHKTAKASAEVIDTAKGKTMAYLLSDDMQEKLNKLMLEQVYAAPQVPLNTDLTEVVVEDKTEEKENRRKKILIWTGLGCLGVCGLGGAAEYLGFRFRLKKNFAKR